MPAPTTTTFLGGVAAGGSPRLTMRRHSGMLIEATPSPRRRRPARAATERQATRPGGRVPAGRARRGAGDQAVAQLGGGVAERGEQKRTCQRTVEGRGGRERVA